MDKLDTNIVWHMGVIVKDVEAASKKVQEIFGFEDFCPVKHNGSVAYDKTNCIYCNELPIDGNFDSASYDFGSIQIEFVAPASDGPSAWRDYLEKYGPGIHHIAWKVRDLDEAVEFLESKGIKNIQRASWPTGRYSYLDGIDSIGMVMEALEFDGERKAGKELVAKWYEKD